MSISQLVFTQNALLKVFDEETKQALPYANICFESLKTKVQHYSVTTMKGEVKNTISEDSQIIISFVGYKTFIDTIAWEPYNADEAPLIISILSMSLVFKRE